MYEMFMDEFEWRVYLENPIVKNDIKSSLYEDFELEEFKPDIKSLTTNPTTQKPQNSYQHFSNYSYSNFCPMNNSHASPTNPNSVGSTTFTHTDTENEEDAYHFDDYSPGSSSNEYDLFTPSTNRGRKTRDTYLLEQHGLLKFFTVDDIITMSYRQMKQLLRDPTMTPTQRHVVKQIRRRGRNRVAARKCRIKRINSRKSNRQENTKM